MDDLYIEMKNDADQPIEKSAQQNLAMDSEQENTVAADDKNHENTSNYTSLNRDLSTRSTTSPPYYVDIIADPRPAEVKQTDGSTNEGIYQALGERNQYETFTTKTTQEPADETNKIARERFRETVLLVLVFVIAILALFLVILNIAGVIGRNCSCELNEDLRNEVNQLKESLKRFSKFKIGPMGPRGYNGSQGPQGFMGPRGYNGSMGPSGLQGPQGLPGLGNLSLCDVKVKETKISASQSSMTGVSTVEKTGRKILHYSCSSNIADSVQQQLTQINSTKMFHCWCYGKGSYQGFSGGIMSCIITYTECLH